MGGCKKCPFIYKLFQRIRGFQKPLHLGFDFRKAAIGGLGFRCKRKIPVLFHLGRAFPHGKGKGLGNSAPLKGRDLFQLIFGYIPPHIQQFPDTFRRLLPSDKGGMQIPDSVPRGNANALRVIPDGVILILNDQPRTIGAVASLQEIGIVRLVFHEVGTYDFSAVTVIEAHAQGFVNDLLGKLQLREKGLLRFLRYRKAAVQEGNLFLHTGQRRFFNYA